MHSLLKFLLKMQFYDFLLNFQVYFKTYASLLNFIFQSFKLGAGGKPSTWFPPEWLLELSRVFPKPHYSSILLYFTF